MKRLNESPDNIDINGQNISHRYKNVAKAFFLHPSGNIIIGDYDEGHHKLAKKYEINYGDLIFTGRLWFNYKGKPIKVISLWKNYLHPKILKDLVKKIEDKLGISLEGWKLDFFGSSEYEDLYEYIGIETKEPVPEIEMKPVNKKYKGSRADKRPLAWKQAYLKSENKIADFETFKLNEVCDDLDFPDFNIDYKDGCPFFYCLVEEKMIIGEIGDTHGDIRRDDMRNSGRFWLKEDINKSNYFNTDKIKGYNIISFWEYPAKGDWIDFLKIFEKETGHKVFGEKWLVEVSCDPDYDDKMVVEDNFYNYCLIKIDDYIGSENPSEQEKMWHLMKVNDPKRKERKKPEIFGSKADKRPLKWKQALLKSENKINRFKNFFN